MKINYDNAKILKILNDFSNCTNLTASCAFEKIDFTEPATSDSQPKPDNWNYFDSSPKDHFCRLVHKMGAYPNCQKNDAHYKEVAKKELKTVVYTCHAGLCETITPIIFDNIIVGHIICGKFVDAEHRYSSIEKVKEFAVQHNADPDEFVALYKKLPVVSSKQISGAINILNICISYILEEQFIQIKNSALPEQIQAFIINNLSAPLSIDMICKNFYINRQKLHTVFKNSFNDTVKHFIITKRIELAKELLTETNKGIEEIACETGFPNYNYFIRIFKNIVSVPPLQYRKHHTPTNK